jgi:hypothetical protein
MTLTQAGCGRLWEAAQAKHAAKTLQPWEGITACRLDGTLQPLFERWYPGLANDNTAATVLATAA